jgi:hypothetical protein
LPAGQFLFNVCNATGLTGMLLHVGRPEFGEFVVSLAFAVACEENELTTIGSRPRRAGSVG